MKRILWITLALSSALSSCKNEHINATDLMSLELDKPAASADGQSKITATVTLRKGVSADRMNIIFSSDGGLFDGGKSRFLAKAENVNGSVKAKAEMKVAAKPGSYKIAAEPEYDSPLKEYKVEAPFEAFVSEPAYILLEPTGYGIASGYMGEVRVVGRVRNASGNPVSSGFKFLFEDELITGGITPEGKFRSIVNTTGDSSLVRANYSVGSLPVGQKIVVKCTLLTPDGTKTSISSSLTLIVNQ